MKKAHHIALLTLAALAVIAVILPLVWGGALIRKMVNAGGPSLLGVPVTLGDASFQPLRGRLVLRRLSIGNPEGFKTDHLFKVDRIDVRVGLRSLLSDTVVIRQILVEAPEITLERGLRNSNIGALIDALGAQAAPAAETSTKKPGKAVVIDELVITGGKVRLTVTAAMGLAAPITLADVRLTNIGSEGAKAGIGIADTVRIILGTVFKSVTEAVGSVGGMALDGAKVVGVGAVQIGNVAADGVKQLGKVVGGLFDGQASTNASEAAAP